VFVTSHQAHFHGRREVIDAYEPVALTVIGFPEADRPESALAWSA
jgi:hypothetical protein